MNLAKENSLLERDTPTGRSTHCAHVSSNRELDCCEEGVRAGVGLEGYGGGGDEVSPNPRPRARLYKRTSVQCVRAWQYVRVRAGRARVCVFGYWLTRCLVLVLELVLLLLLELLLRMEMDRLPVLLFPPPLTRARPTLRLWMAGLQWAERTGGKGEDAWWQVAEGRREEGMRGGEQGKGGDAGWQVAEAGT